MALDRWIAVFFLCFSILYGYSAFTYELLPFEQNMSFVPNTMPMALAVLGIIASSVILFAPKQTEPNEGGVDIDHTRLGDYNIGQALLMLAAMVLYALALRPLGFLPATILFLIGSGWVLGERKLHVMIAIACVGTIGIWYLVQEVLGIFLRPLPWFMS